MQTRKALRLVPFVFLRESIVTDKQKWLINSDLAQETSAKNYK